MQISDKILLDAKEKSEQILKEAKSEAEAILSNALKSADSVVASSEKKILVSLDENKKKITASAQLEAKLLSERKKNEVIESAFEKASQEIEALDSEKYKAFLKASLQGVPSGISVTLFAPENRLSETKSALKEAGIKVSDEKKGDMKAGLILSGDDFEYDLTLERKIRMIKETYGTNIAGILFGNN